MQGKGTSDLNAAYTEQKPGGRKPTFQVVVVTLTAGTDQSESEILKEPKPPKRGKGVGISGRHT